VMNLGVRKTVETNERSTGRRTRGKEKCILFKNAAMEKLRRSASTLRSGNGTRSSGGGTGRSRGQVMGGEGGDRTEGSRVSSCREWYYYLNNRGQG